MSSANKALLIVMLTATLGLWGCTQNHSGSALAKLRDLEARNAKLEDDYRAATADVAEVRKRLTAAEAQVARLTREAVQLQSVIRERDQLRRQVATTQGERNALQTRLVEFSRELQALAGRVDSAANGAPGAPGTATTSAPAPGNL